MKHLPSEAVVNKRSDDVPAPCSGPALRHAPGRNTVSASRFRLTHVAYEQANVRDQLPRDGRFLRRIAGPDRPDQWLVEFDEPIRYRVEKANRDCRYAVVTRRYRRDAQPFSGICVVGLGFVIDASLLFDDALDYTKCTTQAVGIIEIADDFTGELGVRRKAMGA